MDISLEPALNIHRRGVNAGELAGHSLEEWNEAYTTVESYFHALRVRNKLLLGQLVILVLEKTERRASDGAKGSLTELAMEEMDRVIGDWFAEVLHQSPAETADLLSTRGRLALLLADMPGRWQEQFLRAAPWPDEFVTAMREAYLRAGPDFQTSKMTARPLDLGPMSTLATFSTSRLFRVLAVGIWILFALLLVEIFIQTR